MPWCNSFPIWCEVICANPDCDNRSGGMFCRNRLERVKIRKAAHLAGWKIINGKFVCNICLSREELQK